MVVLPNDGLSQSAVDFLKEEGFTVLDNKVAQEQLANFINENSVEVLLVRSATQVRKELIDQCPNLQVIGRAGVGMDNIDVDYARKKGIKVINTPGASSLSVAELVMAHMRSLARFLYDSNRKMPLEGDSQFKALKKSYAGATELRGKTLGVIGFGRIGMETLKQGIANGMNVLVCDPHHPDSKLLTLSFFDGQEIDFQITPVTMDEVLTQSDFLSLHVPAQENYIIGKEEIEKMKNSAFLINTARGGVVDEKALLEALDNDQLAGAGLDVFEDEPNPQISLLMNPKLSLTPHVGGSTVEAQERIGFELADKVVAIYRGENVES